MGELSAQLAGKVRLAAATTVRRKISGKDGPVASTEGSGLDAARSRQQNSACRHLVAIGSSTGGTLAIETLLSGLPADCPPLVIAQHIPAGFSRAFAQRLNKIFPMQVKQAEEGDIVCEGKVLIAPGNFHMLLQKRNGAYSVAIKDGPLVCYQRPSIDVLFGSVAQVAGADAVAIILMGMGSDGAQGMKRIRDAGGWTIAQDEASCVVYGMPREAVKANAVEESVSLTQIPAALDRALRRPQRKLQPQAGAIPAHSSIKISSQTCSN